MDSFMTIEWDNQCGIDSIDAVNFVNQIGPFLKNKNYGRSISKMVFVMTCMPRDFRQRKKYKKV